MNFRTILAASLATAAGLTAVGGNWYGTNDTDWFNTANWYNGKIGTDSAYFKATDPIKNWTITFTNDATTTSLSFQNGLDTPIVFAGPYGLTCTGVNYLGGGNNGSLTVTAGTHSLTGGWRVGQQGSGSCSWTGIYRQTGGTMNTGSMELGFTQGGTGKLFLEDGELNIGDDFRAGKTTDTTGIAAISGGTLRTTGTTMIADGTSNGSLTITGGSVELNALHIAQGGSATGVVEIAGGSLTVTNTGNYALSVGYGANSCGKLIVSGTGSLTVPNKDVEVATYGASAHGDVVVLGGTVTLPKALKVAMKEGTTGSLVISNGTVAATGAISVAHGKLTSATGEIAGGTVTAVSDINIANGESSSATYTISGGTVKTTESSIYVGRGASSLGSLKVSGGDIDTYWCLNVGLGVNATGKVEVAGGTFTCDRGMEFGKGTNSVAEIKVSGGKLSEGSNRFKVAEGKGSAVTVEVSGAGVLEALGSPFAFQQADDSTALLTIKDGGTASLSQITTASTGSGTARVVFDGGTLKANNNTPTTAWLAAADGISYQIGAGGATIDTIAPAANYCESAA